MKTRRTMHVGASPTIFLKARRLRKRPTPSEELLWSHLRNKQMEGVKFRRQHPINDYVVDLYLFTLNQKHLRIG